MRPFHRTAATMLLALSSALLTAFANPVTPWTQEELGQLRALSIRSLPAVPADPSNRVADDPRAAALGHRLFFDQRLSANGKVACASCHAPDKLFQDGTPLAKGVGTTDRRTMSIIGTAHSPWQFWDGRKDSQWAQALGPLESAVEHGGDRTQYVHLLARDYRADYEAVFGKLPDLSGLPAHAGPVQDAGARAAWEALPKERREQVSGAFANLGKAIAAYERRIEPGASRFDTYAQAALAGDRETMQRTLTRDEVAGLKLFLGKAQCVQCHGGPLFTNNAFHNTGVPQAAAPDTGRLAGSSKVLQDEFNCLGPFSDARPQQCGELRFVDAGGARQMRQFRVPSLRNVAQRAPYMHAGQFATLKEVLQHYNRAPAAPQGQSELKPLRLSDGEIDQLAAFLGTVSGGVNAEARWLQPPEH